MDDREARLTAAVLVPHEGLEVNAGFAQDRPVERVLVPMRGWKTAATGPGANAALRVLVPHEGLEGRGSAPTLALSVAFPANIGSAGMEGKPVAVGPAKPGHTSHRRGRRRGRPAAEARRCDHSAA